jgi:hypothetical protein
LGRYGGDQAPAAGGCERAAATLESGEPEDGTETDDVPGAPRSGLTDKTTANKPEENRWNTVALRGVGLARRAARVWNNYSIPRV